MKRIALTILASILVAPFASAAQAPQAATPAAQQQQRVFTGDDYVKLTAKQKVSMVSGMINDAGKAGVGIQKTPIFYCKALDNFYEKSPQMKSHAFNNVFKTLIVMEYDWDQPGVDKEVLAKQWLGDELYKSNKARLQQKK